MLDKLNDLNPTAKKNLEIYPDEISNAEVEKHETILNQKGLFRVEGKDAKSHKQGGVPTILEEGDFVFSNKIKVKGKELSALFPWLKENKTYSIADISKSGPLSKFNDHLNNLNSDYKLDKETAEKMTGNIINRLSALSVVQEAIKGFPNGIPKLGEAYLGELQSMSNGNFDINSLIPSNGNKFATGGEKTRTAGYGQYNNRSYLDLIDQGVLDIEGIPQFNTVFGQHITDNGLYGQTNVNTQNSQLNRLNAARKYTGLPEFKNTDTKLFQSSYNKGFKSKTGQTYFDENIDSPYGIDGKWGQYTLSTPVWGMDVQGTKSGRINFNDLINGTISEDQLKNDWGLNKEDIINKYKELGEANAGVAFINVNPQVAGIRENVDLIGNSVNDIKKPIAKPTNIAPTINTKVQEQSPASVYNNGEASDTGYNMMESLGMLLSTASLNMPDIYPKRYENYGLAQAMGLVQNSSPIDLESQRETVRQQAAGTVSANNALSTTSSQAAINNQQVFASALGALNQIEGQEYNANVQREDQRSSILSNLIANRGQDLMTNARQYNTEMDALKQNKYEDRLSALRGIYGTLSNNYNNRLQRNIVNEMYGDNMQIDAEGRVYMKRGSDIEAKAKSVQADPNAGLQEKLIAMADDESTDPKLRAVILQALTRSTFGKK